MKKRDRLEVIHDILQVIQSKNNSIKPTPLLRYSNLSSQSFKEYISELKEKKLVLELEDKKGRKYYSLSEQGFKFLEKYKMILGFVDEFDL